MDTTGDFAECLHSFMERSYRSTADLARMTGISARTIEKWIRGEARRPRHVCDILKVARALTLTASEANTLLTLAGHLPLQIVREQAQQMQDEECLALFINADV